MEPRSVQSSDRARRLRLALPILVLVIFLGVFASVDITSEAEPSWLEARLASTLLQMKLRFNNARRVSPFPPTERDLELGSDLYQRQCGYCHGVTRGKMAPLANSLSPRPPQFVIKPAERPTWMDAYVIQHGIRWSGMPAFRGMSEADAWRLALYVEGRTKPREE